MKKILFSLALVSAFGAFAAIDTIALFPGSSATVGAAAKVIGIRALSSVADGSAAVKVESKHFTNALDITSSSQTTKYYTLVWSNGTEVVTNTSTRADEFIPLPPARALISYTTNEVTVTTYTTNVVPALAVCVTNTVDELTCSGGYALEIQSNQILVGGDKLFFTGTAKGRVEVIVER